MSTGNTRSNNKVHAVKKARSGTDPQLITLEVDLSITLSPRRAATEVGHDTKQDWLDFQGAGEDHHKLTRSSLGSTGPPQRLPLTEESLSLLNSNKSPPKEVIDASHPAYLKGLRYRQISLKHESRHRHPPELEKWWTTLRAPRGSPEPDQIRVKSLLGATDRTLNKDEMLEHIVPKFVPNIDLNVSDTLLSVMQREWKSKLHTALEPGLTPPKPSLTIGWQTDLFDQYPIAMASLDASACPMPSAEHIAWPSFTAEAKGEADSLREARSRNLHNAAIMLSNLHALKQKCKREETFFDKVHVMGIEFFGVSVSLSCYWATRTEAGHVKYLGKTLDTWCLLTRSETSCKEARTCVRNAIDWLLSETRERIHSDLQAYEDMLVDVPLANLMAPIYTERSRQGSDISTAISS